MAWLSALIEMSMVIGAALMSMIILPIVSRAVHKVTDGIVSGRASHIKYIMSGFYSVRNDIHNKIEMLPHIDDVIKRSLKNTYICVVLIIIEIVFSSLMTHDKFRRRYDKFQKSR